MKQPLQSKHVVVAISGGVDSATAAFLLRQAGYEVTGVFFCLRSACTPSYGRKTCCSPEDAADARRIADKLGIEFHVIDVSKDFEPIIDYFVEEYKNGRTPNPCILCNERVKFARLLEFADSAGAAYVATGHYARVTDYHNKPVIARAAAAGKDQSYVLFSIPPDKISRILFPLGRFPDKDEVRKTAKAAGLDVYDKPDSQEICFAPDGDWKQLLKADDLKNAGAGVVRDSSGKVLGHHNGYADFTIGQRHGLGIAGGIPLYVTGIDAESCEITIGPRCELEATGLKAVRANWFVDVDSSFEACVKIRYNNKPSAATVFLQQDNSFEVRFAAPVLAITPGQAAVVYKEDILLGGGWIESAFRRRQQ